MSWERAERGAIRGFYTDEFPAYRDQLPEYIHHQQPVEYGIAFREDYPVVGDGIPPRDFIRRGTWATDNNDERIRPHFSTFDDLLSFIQHPARHDPLREVSADTRLADPTLDVTPSRPAQAALYYSTETYDGPWQLFIDIDAKDIAEQRARATVGAADIPADRPTADDYRRVAGIVDADPAGYHYAFTDIERAIEYGFEVRRLLRHQFNASDVEVRYSGQGCHVIGLDTDRGHEYDTESRLVLARLLEEKFGIPIDAEVTPDHARLTRVPFSLHSEVSRVVMPIESAAFDFREEALPQFVETTHRGGNSSDEPAGGPQSSATAGEADGSRTGGATDDSDTTAIEDANSGAQTPLSKASPEEIRAALSDENESEGVGTDADVDSSTDN